MIKLQTILDEKDVEKIKELAKKENRSVSNFLKNIIKKSLETGQHE